MRFERIADYSRDFIGTCDLNGVPIYINPAGLRLVGLENISAAGATRFTDFFFAEDVELVQNTLLPRVLTEDYAEMEIRLRHFKTQEPIWMNYAVFTVKNDAGEIVSVATISRNIDEQKKNPQNLEQQVAARTLDLHQANEKLERMNKELDSFTYTASHDLQNPLRKIQDFASRIQNKESANFSTQGHEYFRRLQNSVQQMQTLIGDLLTYSHTTMAEKVFQPTDLNRLLAEVKSDLEREIQDKQATVDTGILPTLPIIPFQFRQLFTNLLSNALKFARKDVLPRIAVWAEQQPGYSITHPGASADRTYYHLTVADNGIGFDPVYSTRIFEVFQRLHGQHEYPGTGVGLAICKKNVESHNGFIVAEGVPGTGATFHVYVPER